MSAKFRKILTLSLILQPIILGAEIAFFSLGSASVAITILLVIQIWLLLKIICLEYTESYCK